jgi:hypothetical protein
MGRYTFSFISITKKIRYEIEHGYLLSSEESKNPISIEESW